MKTIRLSSTDVKFLIDVVDAPLRIRLKEGLADGEYLAKGKYPTGSFLFEFSFAECDRFVDLLSLRMLEVGIDEDGEINDLGIQLDNAADQFNIH